MLVKNAVIRDSGEILSFDSGGERLPALTGFGLLNQVLAEEYPDTIWEYQDAEGDIFRVTRDEFIAKAGG